MNNLLLEFVDVSKRYLIGERCVRTLHEDIERLATKIFKSKKEDKRELWALRNINFNIPRGESVGLIGQNGSGKTTIFKLIANVTFPTKGEIFVNCKVGSLIDLYAGFHPDLTGLENIYLSASIRGMRRKEIKKSLEEIISFAEIERFKDTPIKHYSSGMIMRLGFSVATKCPFDMLLIDEFIAVGDRDFQRKCFDRIAQLQDSGKSIFFVSQDIERVKQVCSRIIYLSQGEIVIDAGATETINKYLNDG